MAGDLNRVRQVLGGAVANEARAEANGAQETMAQEAFSDYHLYTLGRKTTVNNNETKQVSMLNATGFPVHEAVRRGRPALLLPQRAASGLADQGRRAGVLPAQERTEDGTRPADAGRRRSRVSGRLTRRPAVRRRGPHRSHAEGRNAESQDRQRVRRDVRAQADGLPARCASNVYEVEYEVTLRNHKTAPISVEVNEPIGGSWRMLHASHAWTKTDAWAARFDAPVAVDGTTVVKYRVRVTY